MAVTRSNTGTTTHQAHPATSPDAVTGASVTIGASDTGLFVAVTYSQNSGSGSSMVAAVKADPAGANVTVPLVSGTHGAGFGGNDASGWSDIFLLQSPVASLGTGSKNITVTLSGWAGSVGDTCIVIPWTVQGAIGTVTGGRATSVNGASTISSGSLVVGTGGYGVAIAANGSTQPTVNTGTSLLGVTGSTGSGSDNALTLDETANGALIANVNNADESQLAWVTITAAATGKGIVAPAPRARSALMRAR